MEDGVSPMSGREVRAVRSGAAVLALAFLLAGCAPLPQPTTGAPPPPAPGTSPPATTTPVPAPTTPREPAPTVAASDSGPTRDAERVLATIAEPLGGPPQPASTSSAVRDTARRATALAPAAAHDTLRATRPNDDDGGAVPVPAPTEPLRSPQVTLDTTASAPPATSAPATPPATRAPPPPSSSEPTAPAAPARDPNEPCWRLQVAAPDERAKADSRMEAAQSLLLVPMVIEREKGLWKVRTRDCQSREAADALRRRAIESGFEGAFVVKAAPPR